MDISHLINLKTLPEYPEDPQNAKDPPQDAKLGRNKIPTTKKQDRARSFGVGWLHDGITADSSCLFLYSFTQFVRRGCSSFLGIYGGK